jgi:uncharacterized membrane protein (UPF0136 family)
MLQTATWVYIGLLLAGGLVGFLKAGSVPSLVASLLFGLALTACQLVPSIPQVTTDLFLGGLVVVFGVRLAKTRKFLPAGLLGLVTVALLVGRRLG